MASTPYPAALRSVLGGTLNLQTATIKVMLLNASGTYNSAHANVSDVVANELSGTGYTGGFNGSGRLAAANRTVGGTTTATWTFDSPTWAGINAGTIGAAVVFSQGASDAASPIIAFIDPTDIVTNGGSITVNLNTAALTITPV